MTRSTLLPRLRRLDRDRSATAGFTLLELIVVITIIGIIASMVVVRTSGFVGKSRVTTATADIEAILRVAEAIYTESGRYPESIEDMIDAKDPEGRSYSATLDEYPKDPWGNEYVYEILDDGPVVTCYGADGEPGGEKDNADIIRPDREAGADF